MCFIKTSSSPVTASEPVVEEVVNRKEADASLTKNTASKSTSGYNQNIKTSAIGLTDEANVNKKTLLGE